MNEDRLFEWWMENRFNRFCRYMHAWHKPFNDVGEDHSNERIRIGRTISYLDMDDQREGGGGFIRQYLLIKYAMEFVEYITAAYLQIEQDENSTYWQQPLKAKGAA